MIGDNGLLLLALQLLNSFFTSLLLSFAHIFTCKIENLILNLLFIKSHELSLANTDIQFSIDIYLERILSERYYLRSVREIDEGDITVLPVLHLIKISEDEHTVLDLPARERKIGITDGDSLPIRLEAHTIAFSAYNHPHTLHLREIDSRAETLGLEVCHNGEGVTDIELTMNSTIVFGLSEIEHHLGAILKEDNIHGIAIDSIEAHIHGGVWSFRDEMNIATTAAGIAGGEIHGEHHRRDDEAEERKYFFHIFNSFLF